MQQVNIQGPGKVAILDVPEPEAGPRDVVVDVSACGICGSDLGYVKLGGLAGPTGEPMPLGHELAGTVASVGADVEGIAVGTRVVVNPMCADNQIGNGGSEGGFAPKLLVRNAGQPGCIMPIPDAMPFEHAALAEPLSVGLQVVNRCSATASDKAVVFGAGPIGLAAIASLRYRGAEDIIVVDLSQQRLDIARELGAAHALCPGRDDVWKEIRRLHGIEDVLGAPMAGSDVYIEASGHSPLIEEVLGNAKSDARLGIVALHRAPISVNFLLTPMITHRFPLADFEAALAVAQDAHAGAKVLIVNERV